MIAIITADGSTDIDAEDMLDGMYQAKDLIGPLTITYMAKDQSQVRFCDMTGERVVVADLDKLTAREAFAVAAFVAGK